MNLSRNLEKSAVFFGDRPAIGEAGAEICYKEMNARSNRVATYLQTAGIEPGDYVALCAPNSFDWLVF